MCDVMISDDDDDIVSPEVVMTRMSDNKRNHELKEVHNVSTTKQSYLSMCCIHPVSMTVDFV